MILLKIYEENEENEGIQKTQSPSGFIGYEEITKKFTKKLISFNKCENSTRKKNENLH